MFVGMRVVRGRDWCSVLYENHDGGIGGIGTIIKINSLTDGTPKDGTPRDGYALVK